MNITLNEEKVLANQTFIKKKTGKKGIWTSGRHGGIRKYTASSHNQKDNNKFKNKK